MTLALAPLRNKTQSEVHRVVIEAAGSYGPPAILQSDNGKEFGQLDATVDEFVDMPEVCKTVQDAFPGTLVVHSSVRKPSTNGLVERHNKTIEEMITQFMCKHQTSCWAQLLPAVKLAKNSNICKVRKLSPLSIATGRVPVQEFLRRAVARGRANVTTEDELRAHVEANHRYVYELERFFHEPDNDAEMDMSVSAK